MAKVTLITGGQRSGKSRYAQKLAEENSPNPIYLATARRWDAEFEARIERHKADRGNKWRTVELERFNGDIDFTGETVVLDCVTLWLNNIFFDNQFNVEVSLNQAKEELERLTRSSFNLIVVSNELGMGIIPESKESRQFADLQGWTNQHIAALADTVYLMVSGISLKIK